MKTPRNTITILLIIGAVLIASWYVTRSAEAPADKGVTVNIDDKDLPQNIGDSVHKDGYTITKEAISAFFSGAPTVTNIPKKPAGMDDATYKNLTQSLSAAIDLFEKSGGGEDGLLDVALYNNMLGNSAKSVEIWKFMNERSPGMIQPVANLAQYYLVKQDFKESEKWFLKAITNEPKFTQAYQDLQEIYKAQKRFDEAEGLLKKGIAANPEAHELHVTLAQLYVTENKKTEARKEYEAALTIAGKAKNAGVVAAIRAEISELK
jgi:tetratricopeptide (TPR) repeat protein